jgi:polar amino acid transport system permease protein
MTSASAALIVHYLAQATLVTLELSLTALVPSTILGALLAVASIQGGRLTRTAITGYLFCLRGVPLFVLIIFIYYMLPKTGVDLPPFWDVTLVLTLYYGAFMGEVFRAGVESLPKAQWDAARSLGMPRALMMRTVIFPQALRLATPPYVNLCVNLVKATSLASVVGLRELTLAGMEVVERTMAPLQIFSGVAAIYFAICFSLNLIGRQIERRALVGY